MIVGMVWLEAAQKNVYVKGLREKGGWRWGKGEEAERDTA
jgi:hypothetical protein